MSGKMTYFICFALLIGSLSSVQAVPFSLLPTFDTHVSNDASEGPDSDNSGQSGMHCRNQGGRRRVGFVAYDLSEAQSQGVVFSDVSFSNYGHDTGMINVYGVLEEFEDLVADGMTWNTAPGVQNNPTPALDSDVALDLADVTGILLSFNAPARGTRASTDTSQALADFLNSDTNGFVAFMFAPEGGSGAILRTVELGDDGGTLLEGDIGGLPELALNPIPADEAVDVARDVVLSWTPGGYAEKNDVYLGTNFDDVNEASTTIDPNGVYKGRQDPNQYPALGTIRLKIGKTYYWRIDGVGAAPGNEIYTGKVWQFTIEPFAFAIDGGTIAVRASSWVEGNEPENTVNSSGLDETGLLHGNIGEGTMWLSNEDGEQPTWIEYDFGKLYRLHEMWVWNSNEGLEKSIGIGFKEVVIDYSVDGTRFETLGTTHEFNQAPGTANYAHNTTIDFNDISARYVRLTANSNFKHILNQYSLSEVRFFYIPVQARTPKPASGEIEVPLNVTLNWTVGREADKHNVYLGESEQAVIDNTAFIDTVTEAKYGPLSLNYATTYYWRVDEVNDIEDPAVIEGDIWSFTTKEYLVVDDFELYDANDNQIWYAWKDGLGYGSANVQPYYPGNGTGSAVGDESTDSFTEETIVHEGGQSMPLAFDNDKQGYAKYSEAELTLTYQRDWTAGGVKELSLWFRGSPPSVGSFAEAPAGTYTMTGAGTDIWSVADEFHFAFKTLNGVGTIQAKVLSIDDTDPWAKAGIMIRESLEPGSKFAAVYITPGNGCRFQDRIDTDAEATSDTSVATTEQTAITAPYWIKLERDFAGNFRAYYSSDGTTWQLMSWGAQNISMDSNVYVGLAVTSHNTAATCEGRFSNVTITGTVGTQWANQDIGILSNDPEPMYVAVSNSTGEPVVVVHDDPAATQIETWTEWTISLQDLADQGLNLNDVDSIAIGVGTRGNTKVSGGSGKMFIDDIRLYGPRDIVVEE
ncbi:MAG: discoidin domain-containing protein [Sedimentisphaerales bacterium]|nr:discoidin domain-containing protein [Sedimentisphaerales bacterium]